MTTLYQFTKEECYQNETKAKNRTSRDIADDCRKSKSQNGPFVLNQYTKVASYQNDDLAKTYDVLLMRRRRRYKVRRLEIKMLKNKVRIWRTLFTANQKQVKSWVRNMEFTNQQ